MVMVMVPWYQGDIKQVNFTRADVHLGSAAEGREDPSFVQHDEEHWNWLVLFKGAVWGMGWYI